MIDRSRIKLLLLDCDGVLTDGRLYYSATGEELKVFDVQDGYGIVEWLRLGKKVAIVSGRSSVIVRQRAEELGIPLLRQGVSDKLKASREICAEFKLDLSEAAFIGDDIADIEVMRASGMGVAVANAVDEVKAIADHVTIRVGGRGAVREVIDLLLESGLRA